MIKVTGFLPLAWETCLGFLTLSFGPEQLWCFTHLVHSWKDEKNLFSSPLSHSLSLALYVLPTFK